MFEICLDFSKIGLKIYLFCLHSKKAKKWPNHFISAKQFQKGPNLAEKAKWQPLSPNLFKKLKSGQPILCVGSINRTEI